MVAKRGGLGRNLSALLSQSSSILLNDTPSDNTLITYLTLDIHCLQPGKYQPRREIASDALEELAESIKLQGLLQPLVVREIASGRYEIIAGERRWRACQMAGKIDVSVIVRQVDDETAMALALIENLQREDLNAIDQAFAMQRLINEFDMTHQQIAKILCKSRAAVSNYLRLLNLNTHVRRLLENGDLDMGHARSLLTLDEVLQTKIADMVVARALSVRETEALVARTKTNVPAKESRSVDRLQFNDQLQTLAGLLQAKKIHLRQGKTGGGALMIHYDSDEALENMMGLLLQRN